MLLFLFGTVAVVVATYFTFKTANENGRSGVLWALISLSVGLGLQLVAPVIVAFALALVFIISGTSQNELAEKIDGLATVGYYVCWILSFVSLFLVIKHVSKLPESDDGTPAEFEPPPPPTFGNSI
jgi:hypothetical protein